MNTTHKYALITGSSRGIGRATALKLAAHGYDIAVHYYSDLAAAENTLAKVRALGADGFTIEQTRRTQMTSSLFSVKCRPVSVKLDVFVSNARPELPSFYRTPLELGREHWNAAMDSQARAFLMGTQQASTIMSANRRLSR